MKNNIEMNEKSSKTRNSKLLSILFAGLFTLALAGSIYLFSANEELQSESKLQIDEIESLDLQRINLENELAIVENEFSEKIVENEKLSTELNSNLEEVKALKYRVKQARKKLKASSKENEQIKLRLASLENLKSGLENDIAALALTNKELKIANEEITSELAVSNEYAAVLNEHLVQMSEKNAKLIDRLYTIAPAGFIADNFVVTAKKRNDKLTAKAKYTDRVNVSFDLNDVPGEYQVDEEIYLVLTKFDGEPISTIPSKTVKISSKETFDIKAVDVENLSLSERQNLKMTVETDKDLESGMYNLLVYADHGFLGATSFQLR